MKNKLLNLLLIISSLLGYLSWGGEHSEFLFQVEVQIISKFFSDPVAVFHPFILLPLIGQTILFITLFQKQVNKKLSYLGITCIIILIGFILIIGLLSFKIAVIISTLPFLTIIFIVIKRGNKKV